MTESFDKAFDFIMRWETGGKAPDYNNGGLTNNPKDPGGLTKYGISKRTHPNLAIESLTLDEAKTIYLSEYWNGCKCNDLPYPIDIAVFNLAITSGCRTAINRLNESNSFCDYMIHTIKFYVDIKGQVLEGWLNRAFDLHETFTGRT